MQSSEQVVESIACRYCCLSVGRVRGRNLEHIPQQNNTANDWQDGL